MDSGNANSTRLAWRTTPDLCLNDESLVDIITGLRAQVTALEKNELLSGAALPSWLIKALAEVASNVDAVVECQALRDQVASLQKEVLDLRHEMLLNASSSGSGAASPAYNPTPHHRQSTGRQRAPPQAASTAPRTLIAMPSSKDMSDAFAIAGETASLVQQAGENARPVSNGVSAQYVEAIVKPLWDSVHRQTNDFSALKQAFQEAKDTVTRLQAEIKRRDAVIKARNEKHESVVQTQVDKLNENLRACVTRNDLINAEQRIGQQMKIDRQRMLDEVDARSNKILEDMLTSRSDQEDINSSNAEMMELLTRKQGRTEEIIMDCGRKQDSFDERLEGVKTSLMETTTNLEVNMSAVSALEEKATSFEETQQIVVYLSAEMTKALKAHEELKTYMENRMVEKIAESVAIVRCEVVAVQAVVNDLVNLNLDDEIKAVAAKLEMVALTATDSVRKIAAIQKQIVATDDHNKTQFSQAFDSIDRIQQSLSTLSEESIHLSYTLQRTIDSAEKLTSEVNAYKEVTDRSINGLQTASLNLRSDHEKFTQSMDNELALVKNQLFHFEEVTSAHKREIEETQREVDRNFKNQYHENQAINGSLDSLHTAKKEITARQDAAESQMMALQAENRAEIQAATVKLVAIVDKESDRVESLYASFQEKQEHFADVVARSSIRNMDLADMNREIDRVCENFVSECWKFETSARSSSKHSARPDNNGTGRKQFNERQQQLLVHDCQFIADLMVARAEYEILQTGCNKEVRNQHTMDEDMLNQQGNVMEKIRVKIHTKIMNNKNIGEQFDKSTLDRRELYIDTINNMMIASMKRRTLVGGDSNRQRNTGHDDTVSTTRGEFLETTRLVGLSSASKGASRRKTVRDSISVTAAGLPDEAPTSRTAFTPSSSSSYVLRAGFRLPKASTPSSPMTPFRNESLTTPLSSRSSFELTNESPGGGGGAVLVPENSRMKSPETPAENLQGWSTDDTKDEGGMAKSYSLPALKQQ